MVVLVVSFLGIREVLQFVSLVLFCQVVGVECWGAVDVVRRRGADETRLVPLGRGGGRGAPHEIHVGRLQGLRWVLLVLPLVQVFLVNIFFQVVCPLQAEFC